MFQQIGWAKSSDSNTEENQRIPCKDKLLKACESTINWFFLVPISDRQEWWPLTKHIQAVWTQLCIRVKEKRATYVGGLV